MSMPVLQTQVQQGVQHLRNDGKSLPPHGRAMYDYISKEQGYVSINILEKITLRKSVEVYLYFQIYWIEVGVSRNGS